MQKRFSKYERSQRNQGVGVYLIVVLSVLITLATIGIYNYIVVQRVTTDLGTTVRGDRALYIARSAVEEAIQEFANQVNTPGSAIFDDIRDESQAFEELSYSLEAPTVVTSLKEDEYKGYELESDSVALKLHAVGSFTGLRYEKYGTAIFTASVSYKSGFRKLVRRTVTQKEEFRMNLISMVRPFDQFTYYLNSPLGVVRPERENSLIEQSVTGITTDLPGIRKAYIDYMNKEFDQLPGDKKSMLLNAMKNPPLPTDYASVDQFKPDPVIVSTVKDYPDLSKLNLAGNIEPVTEEIRTLIDQVDADSKALDNAINTAIDNNDQGAIDSTVKPAVEKLAQSTYDLAIKHQERLQIYADFRSIAAVVSGGGATYFRKHFKKFGIGGFDAKANYMIPSPAQQNLDRLLKAYQPLNGVVMIHNEGEPVTLPAQVEGKVVFVTKGDVNINGLAPMDPSKHVVSVISYGKMKVGGVIEASLAALGEFQPTAGNVQIKGNLVLNVLKKPDLLKGQMVYDEKIHSGTTSSSSDANAKRPYYFVALGPRTLDVKVSRK